MNESVHENELGQPVGPLLPNWSSPPRLQPVTLAGRFCRVEPLSAARHAADLFAANSLDADGTDWTYLATGPFTNLSEYYLWIEKVSLGDDPLFHAIIDASTQKPVGSAAYMRINPEHGVVEIGSLKFSPLMQKTPLATEAMYLMMRQAFELGYRRYEWKCDSCNIRSRAAAARLGFSYEGIFRQAMVIRGRNRDTAWHAVIDSEWPALKAAFERWLAPENFDAGGKQFVSLSSLTKPLLKNNDCKR